MPLSKKNTCHKTRNVNQQDGVISVASITKEERLYTIANIAMLLCTLIGVSRPTIQRKLTEVM